MCRHFSYLCFVEDSNAHCEFCSDGCNLGGAGLDTSVLFPVRVRSQICVSLLSYEYNQSMCLLYHSGPGGVVVHPTCVRLSCGRANGEFFPHLQRLVNWGMWQAWGYSLEVAC